jgi:alpha-1,3-rhamnosyl/mannosyltransferase
VRREVIADLGVAPERVTAVPNGINSSFRPVSPEQVEPVRRRLDLPEHYFLCVGTIEPRKNILMAMRAFTELPAKVREGCPLVLAGPWGWKAEAGRDYYETVGRHRGVRHLGYVMDADLPAVYAGAVGLVYPSHYEGFGLPPVEMLASGGAVLASTDPAVREVCGSHAEFIDPNDLPGWRAAMHQLATDLDYRNRLARGGPAHASQFTWERAAHETSAVYHRALGLPDAITPSSAHAAA